LREAEVLVSAAAAAVEAVEDLEEAMAVTELAS